MYLGIRFFPPEKQYHSRGRVRCIFFAKNLLPKTIHDLNNFALILSVSVIAVTGYRTYYTVVVSFITLEHDISTDSYHSTARLVVFASKLRGNCFFLSKSIPRILSVLYLCVCVWGGERLNSL